VGAWHTQTPDPANQINERPQKHDGAPQHAGHVEGIWALRASQGARACVAQSRCIHFAQLTPLHPEVPFASRYPSLITIEEKRTSHPRHRQLTKHVIPQTRRSLTTACWARSDWEVGAPRSPDAANRVDSPTRRHCGQHRPVRVVHLGRSTCHAISCRRTALRELLSICMRGTVLTRRGGYGQVTRWKLRCRGEPRCLIM
jgi:hypothetical protein